MNSLPGKIPQKPLEPPVKQDGSRSAESARIKPPIIPLNTELHAQLIHRGVAVRSTYESAMIALDRLRKQKRDTNP